MGIAMADIREWRGQPVVDEKDRRIGTLESVYVETATDEPFFATVLTGVAKRRLVFVPLEGSVAGPAYLRVPYPKAKVKQAPAIGTDDVLPATDEPEVFAYYELPYATGTGGERRLARR